MFGFQRRLGFALSVASVAILFTVVSERSDLLGKPALGAAAAPAIVISPLVPAELNPGPGPGSGAPNATLAQAAAFAWQEFIALSWPAATSNGQGNPQRDTPDTSCLFGDSTPRCAAQPLTWQTFRGKAEIFTNGNSDPSYDSAPNYNGRYPSGDPQPCAGPAPAQAAWINLDETSQIFEDAMFAGAAPTSSAVNSQPQLVRFLAKANRPEFTYYNKLLALPNNGFATLQRSTVATLKSVGTPPQSAQGNFQYIGLPTNTIEIKAGWRMLNATEIGSGRFHMARVRYYEPSSTNPPVTSCYREGMWGLVALHIIQKTASAPYFIYATFEQTDNILDPNGVAVEDANGVQRPIGLPPTSPVLAFNDTPIVSSNQIPPQVTRAAGSSFCTPGPQLYYRDLLPALPTGGPICVNRRYNAIPGAIIAANQAAHSAIAGYNAAHNLARSPWPFYKLVNVQYVPYSDETPATPFSGNDPTTGNNPQNFYLANIVVETNRPLQMFSGSLVKGNPGTGSNSNYDAQFGGTGTGVHRNLYYTAGGLAPKGYNMGGCMGCHGAQGQSGGGDFSVILARGQVGDPESLPNVPPTAKAVAAAAPRPRRH
jgi:hypothetical protein